MSIGNLPSNKLVSLTLQGYNPFQPDCGIYCGGYQGIMYPNPTTLIAPSILFDPYEYTSARPVDNPDLVPYKYANPVASEYPIGPPYHGLGKGNPGINYLNPGHILGLLDTYGRMIYGMDFLGAAHAGTDIAESTPSISEASLPFLSGTPEILDPVQMEPSYPPWIPPPEPKIRLIDIYPELTEKPGDWYDYFSIDPTDGSVDPDIRPWVSFTVGSPYLPRVATIDGEAFNKLFPSASAFGNSAGKLLNAYPDVIDRFRTYLQQLHTVAEPLASLFTTSFTLTNAKYFDTYTGEAWMPNYDTIGGLTPRGELEIIDKGTYSHQCAVLTPLQAINALTKEDGLHGGEEDPPPRGELKYTRAPFEYRSLTELNSVINLVPIQAAGASFQTDIIYPFGGSINNLSLHNFWVYAFTIVDVVVNLSESDVSLGTVSINGNVTMRSLITDPSPFYTTAEYREVSDPPQAGWEMEGATGETTITDYDVLQRSKKRVDMRAMLTNKHSFDKVWLGTESDEQHYSVWGERDILMSQGDIDISNFVVPFSNKFNLSAGCNSLKMRFIVRNKHFIQPDPDLSRYISEDSWSPFSEMLPAPWYAIMLGTAEPGDMWLWYNGGTQSCGRINDPDILRNSIVSPSIIIFLSISSPGRNSITREISI